MQQHFRHAIRFMGVALIALGAVPPPAAAAKIEVAPGLTIIANDGQCSLTEALNNANADAQVDNDDCVAGFGVDVLLLAPETTYVLLAPLPAVTSSIFIEGNGSVIQRSDAVPCTINGTTDPGEFRLFLMTSGELSMLDLTLRNGCADGGFSSPDRNGAAVRITGGSAVFERVGIEDNSARGAGAMAVADAAVGIFDSILRNNDAEGSGGAINNHGTGTMTISGSTISGNLSRGAGGGGVMNGGSMTLVNSTISDNFTMPTDEFAGGGGLANYGSASLVNVTVAANADNLAGGMGGGGIMSQGPLSIRNSVVGGNLQGGDCAEFSFGIEAEAENVDTDGSCSDLVSGNFTTVTPQALALGPLQDNGGPTPTHLPGPASVVIDAVPLCTYLAAPLTIDQRGVSRPQLEACDLGAVEVEPLPEEIFADGFEASRDTLTR